MAEKEILQRGNRVSIDSKGVKTSRPMTDDDLKSRSGPVLGGASGAAESKLRGRGAQLDEAIRASEGQHGQADRTPYNWTK